MVQRSNRFLAAAVVLAGATALPLSARAGGQAAAAFDVVDYGAVSGGKTMNTVAFAKAIGACVAAGGGRVVVPAGTFLTGPIQLKSNVELHVSDGATVLFSRDIGDYPKAAVQAEKEGRVQLSSPLWADGAHDVSVTGSGVFDGQGEAWRPVKKAKVTDAMWGELVKSGKGKAFGTTWYPTRSDVEAGKDGFRPSLVLLSNCRRVVLDGPTFRNSPGWNVHLLLSEDVTVRGVTIFNEAWAQNGDSLDVQSCRNVVVTNSSLSGGDDVICFKSGKDEAGRRRGRATENVFVANCVIGTGHGGITVGSEMSGGVRNVTVTNCIMNGTNGGIRFKTTRGRGGIVENINISNIEMRDLSEAAIGFDMYYGSKQAAATSRQVDEGTPRLRQIRISNVNCTGARTGVELRGLPEMPLDRVTLENVRIAAKEAGSLIDCSNVTLRDVRIEAPEPATVRNVRNLTMERVEGVEAAKAGVAESGNE